MCVYNYNYNYIYIYIYLTGLDSRRNVQADQWSPASRRGLDKHCFSGSAILYHNYDIIMA